MRIITGAPKCTRLLNLLQEIGLVSISDRLAFVQAAFVIKTVKNLRKSHLQSKLLEDFVTNRAVVTPKTWSLQMS